MTAQLRSGRRRRLTRATRGLRLRARIIAAFGLGGFLLSVLLAASTYSLTRSATLSQRESSAEQQFFLNARTVQRDTQSEDISLDLLLQSLPRLAGARPIVNTAGGAQDAWNAPSLTPQELPQSLIESVAGSTGEAAMRQRYSLNGLPRLAMGIRFAETDVLYFEMVELEDVADNMRSLAIILIAATVVTTLAGIGLGVWIGGRVLRPLADVSSAAQAIAAGRLDTRLQDADDPDLAPLVNSFNDMVAALEERIERDARFASDVSHELRSPLMTLRASIDVLETRRGELSERAQQALDLLSSDVDRFQRLVQDLLEISRVDAGAVDLAFDQIQLGDLVTHAVESSNHGEGVPVAIAQDVSDAFVVGDKRRLAQVVSNLLDNAANYGGGATSVSVLGDRQVVRIAVEDAGPGVPDEEKDLIFERFARGASAGARRGGGGAGLGLALVAEHVALHDGDVWVEDRHDGMPGARFVIELPRVAE